MATPKRAVMLARSVETYVDIDAPPDRVWDVLLDFPAWADWNLFIPLVEGTLEVGRKVHIKVVPVGRKPHEFNPEVWIVRPCEEILWGGGFLGIVFRGDHVFLLEPLPGGRTRFRQRERFRGLPVLFMLMGGLFGPIEQGYHLMNHALKQRVESGELGAPSLTPEIRHGRSWARCALAITKTEWNRSTASSLPSSSIGRL